MIWVTITMVLAILVLFITLTTKGGNGNIDTALKTCGICIMLIIGCVFILAVNGIADSITPSPKQQSDSKFQAHIDSLQRATQKSIDSLQRKSDSIFTEYVKRQEVKNGTNQ